MLCSQCSFNVCKHSLKSCYVVNLPSSVCDELDLNCVRTVQLKLHFGDKKRETNPARRSGGDDDCVFVAKKKTTTYHQAEVKVVGCSDTSGCYSRTPPWQSNSEGRTQWIWRNQQNALDCSTVELLFFLLMVAADPPLVTMMVLRKCAAASGLKNICNTGLDVDNHVFSWHVARSQTIS